MTVLSGSTPGARPNRFYEAVGVAETEAGAEIRLDGRTAKTPARAPLAAPTRALGEAVAAEWAAQGARIEPLSMPLTRLLTTAIDRGPAEAPAWRADLARYAGSDLLCYRAEAPYELAARQAAAWDPYLHWAEAAHGLRLVVTAGVMAIEQPAASLAAARAVLDETGPARLIALKSLAELSGSFVLALAVAAEQASAEEAFVAARLDEIYQAEQWGLDAEAEARAKDAEAAFAAAARFLTLAP